MAKKSKRVKSETRSAAMKESHARRGKQNVIPMNGTKTELNFLDGMFKRESFWNYARVKKLVDLLRQGKTVAGCANYLATSPNAVKMIIAELRRAGHAGFTLEDYFRKNRPLRYGKKIVAK